MSYFVKTEMSLFIWKTRRKLDARTMILSFKSASFVLRQRERREEKREEKWEPEKKMDLHFVQKMIRNVITLKVIILLLVARANTIRASVLSFAQRHLFFLIPAGRTD